MVMEIKLEVFIPIVVVLSLLVITVTIIVCYFYICPYCKKKRKKNAHYSKLINPNLTMASERRKHRRPRPVTIRPPTPPLVKTSASEQSTRYKNFSSGIVYNDAVVSGQSCKNQFNFLPLPEKTAGETAGKNFSPKNRSNTSTINDNNDIFHFNESRSPRSPRSPIAIFQSKHASDFVSPSTAESNSRLSPKMKSRFRSEPILNTFDDDVTHKDAFGHKRQRHDSTHPRSRAKALSVLSPADGQVEFTLYYDPEVKSLTINLVQLVDVCLKPECFIGILNVFDKDQNERKKSTTVHLIRNSDNTLRLSEYADTGFLLYLSLLPNLNFTKHTNVIFGKESAVFNERFTIQGQTLESIRDCYLCIHALCKFGRDGEPIVLGEVSVPLKRLQSLQVLPFMANLQGPCQEIELEAYLKSTTNLGNLEIYLSFNPIAQTLVVKVLQASDLPKIGMTGQPNVSVKISLYYCNLRVAKKTTSVQKRQKSPIFNETFEFQLSKDRISECDVLFEIRHHGPMYRTVIGYVIVGNSAGGEGTKQWRQLLDFSCHEKMYKIMLKKPVGLS